MTKNAPTLDRKQRERLLHEKLAHGYEHERETHRNSLYYSKMWYRHLLHIGNVQPHMSLLDLGCGTSLLYDVIQEDNIKCHYTGIDYSPHMIAVGKKRHPFIDLHVMDAEQLHFKDKKFDTVLVRGTLHHLPNPETAIQEIKRVCKGTIIISEPVANIFATFPRWILRKTTKHFDDEHFPFVRRKLRDMIEKSGMTVQREVHFGFFAFPLGFTDILPFVKFVPLPILKACMAIDRILGRIPILNLCSWHSIYICKN